MSNDVKIDAANKEIADAFKVEIDEQFFEIYFGKLMGNNDANVISRIKIKSEDAISLILTIYQKIQSYEAQYNRKLFIVPNDDAK